MTTRTGSFRIGVRAGHSSWQSDLAGFTRWAAEAGFTFLDLGPARPADVRVVQSIGLDVVAVDLLDGCALLSVHAQRRQEAVARNAAYMHEMAGLEVSIFRAVAEPENPTLALQDNFARAAESFGELAALAESLGTRVVLEGEPGRSPPYPNLCCNPEQCRAMLKAVPSKGLALAYDPSPLIRMGIDHVRFLDEFVTRVGHVLAKDTEIVTDNLYEIGCLQQSLTETPWDYGELVWRYTIPGQGAARWSYILRMLQLAGYKGSVSLRLEDANFNGTESGEKAGLLGALQYLSLV